MTLHVSPFSYHVLRKYSARKAKPGVSDANARHRRHDAFCGHLILPFLVPSKNTRPLSSYRMRKDGRWSDDLKIGKHHDTLFQRQPGAKPKATAKSQNFKVMPCFFDVNRRHDGAKIRCFRSAFTECSYPPIDESNLPNLGLIRAAISSALSTCIFRRATEISPLDFL